MRALAVLVTFACVGLMAACAVAQEEGEGGAFIARPLDVEILFPSNDSQFAAPSLTALIEADGEGATSIRDDFVNGTFVNTSFDAQGLKANASGPTNESYYISRVFELPPGGGPIEWTTPLDILTSGSSANLTPLLAMDARFGDRTPGRNWSAWFPVALDGDLGDPRGPANESLLDFPAFEYRIRFLEPANASSPSVVFVEVWFLAHIVEVSARVGPAAAWTPLGTTDGRYNFSITLAPGASVVEARVRDAAGAERVARATVTYDIVRPTVERAPANGSSIPEDTAAEIRFSEPIDRASASTNIHVSAPFPVDLVWSGDNRSLFLSAQESGQRAAVTITLDSGLRDRVGNTMGTPVEYTYQMGKAPQRPPENSAALWFLVAAVAAAAAVALVISARAKQQKDEHAQRVRKELESSAEGTKPPEEPQEPAP